MWSSGSAAAPWTCLRCELRRALRSPRPGLNTARRPGQQARLLSHSAGLRGGERAEEADRNKSPDAADKPYIYRHLHPHGRVIGRPGRRRYETSEKLSIASLEQQSEVIVLRDIHEPPPSSHVAQVPSTVPSDVLARALAQEHAEPSEREITASIDALRPNATALTPTAYERLAKTLAESYHAAQMAKYLSDALRLAEIESDLVYVTPEASTRTAVHLPRSKWRPGQTALEERHKMATMIKKTELAKSKPKLAKQILQLAWNIAIESEDSVIGELELLLEPWQLTFLFDLVKNEQPMYQSLLGSALILRVADIRPYRPDNIARITARRQVAEEIVGRLESSLSQVSRLTMDLSIFTSLLGTAGRPYSLRRLFDERSLHEICLRTRSAVQWEDDKTLAIYNLYGPVAQTVRRLLLSLLNLPDLARDPAMDGEVVITPRAATPTYSLPEAVTSGLQGSQPQGDLVRQATPTLLSSSSAEPSRRSSLAQPEQAEREVDAAAQQIADALDRTPYSLDKTPSKRDFQSYWGEPPNLQPKTWSAQVCRILHHKPVASPTGRKRLSKRKRDVQSASPREVALLQPQVPGVASLLSYFTPVHRPSRPDLPLDEARSPFLLAHLMPSPFTSTGLDHLRALPRIEMRYHLHSPEDSDQLDVQLVGMNAILREQQIRVPLPWESNDLCFSRRTDLRSVTLGPHSQGDIPLRSFTHTLRRSLEEDHHILMGEPTLTLTLPAWLHDDDHPPGPDFAAEYVLERFAQVQIIDFLPLAVADRSPDLDDEVRAVLARFPPNAFLRYRDVQAGVIGGQRAELSVLYTTPSADGEPVTTETRTSEDGTNMDGTDGARSPRSTLALARTALDLTRLLSRINGGTLAPRRIGQCEMEGSGETAAHV